MTTRTAYIATRTAPRKTGILNALLTAQAIWRERRRLAAMETDMLRDIGCSAREAQAESRRPVWDAPARWRS